MTECKQFLGCKIGGASLRRGLHAFLCASFLILSGCSDFRFPSFNGNTSQADKALKDEVSLMQSEIDSQRDEATKSSTKNLFGRSLRSDEERINRLERAVQSMRNEFDSVRPSIRRLSALEGEIQTLIKELRTLNGTPEPASRAQQYRVPANLSASSTPAIRAPQQIVNNYSPPRSVTAAKPTSYQKKSPPPASGGQATIYDVRVGEHPGRTRLVLDSNNRTAFNVDIDNAENIAVIDLPNAAWSASMAKNFARSSFISSYNVEPSGNGHILILRLKRNAKVSYKDDLKGTKGASRRFVIDFINS